jgi:hypothetical protein
MKPTSADQAGAKGRSAEEGFDELRDTFCIRLKNERILLVALGAGLERGDPSRMHITSELGSRAHRISGTAAILELAAVSKAARALELAVVSVAASHGRDADRVIWDAIDGLVGLIERLEPPSRDFSGPDAPGSGFSAHC